MQAARDLAAQEDVAAAQAPVARPVGTHAVEAQVGLARELREAERRVGGHAMIALRRRGRHGKTEQRRRDAHRPDRHGASPRIAGTSSETLWRNIAS